MTAQQAGRSRKRARNCVGLPAPPNIAWKKSFNVEPLIPEQTRRRRTAFDQGKMQAKHAQREAGVARPDTPDAIA